MERALRTTVSTAARKVRAWCEAENSKRAFPVLGNDLSGWCAIASARLWKELQAKGINAEIHLSQEGYCAHVFLVVDDHVVDVTATQFRPFTHQPLVIKHLEEAEVHWFYNANKKFDHIVKLREDQVTNGWPVHQTVPA